MEDREALLAEVFMFSNINLTTKVIALKCSSKWH